jgi:hypothetical protein
MIVHEFNVRWTLGGPAKAKPVLIVDPNAVLSFAVTLQRFHPVARWRAQELERFSSIQLRRLSRRSFSGRREPLALATQLNLELLNEMAAVISVQKHPGTANPSEGHERGHFQKPEKENDCENRYLERVVGGQPSYQ